MNTACVCARASKICATQEDWLLGGGPSQYLRHWLDSFPSADIGGPTQGAGRTPVLSDAEFSREPRCEDTKSPAGQATEPEFPQL